MESKDKLYHAGDWIVFWDEMTHSYQHLRGFPRDNLKPFDIGQRPQLIEINSINGYKIISPSD